MDDQQTQEQGKALPNLIVDPLELIKHRAEIAKPVAFIPFLGGLHKGHVALVEAAKQLNIAIWCSIYLNRLQFQSKTDVDTYPAVLEEDIRTLTALGGVNVIFIPTQEMMYQVPVEYYAPRVIFESLDSVEGESVVRPGFFKGIGTVVTKLLCWIRPQYLFLGQKDFQQTVVLRCLCDEFFPCTYTVVHPTIRDTNQLATASRNKRLSSENIGVATQIYAVLTCVKSKFDNGERNASALIKAGIEVAFQLGVTVDYLTLADWFNGINLNTAHLNYPGKYCLSIGASIQENCRLIDNIVLSDLISCGDLLNPRSTHSLILESQSLALCYIVENDLVLVLPGITEFLQNPNLTDATMTGKEILASFQATNKYCLGLFKTAQRYSTNAQIEDGPACTDSAKCFTAKRNWALVGLLMAELHIPEPDNVAAANSLDPENEPILCISSLVLASRYIGCPISTCFILECERVILQNFQGTIKVGAKAPSRYASVYKEAGFSSASIVNGNKDVISMEKVISILL